MAIVLFVVEAPAIFQIEGIMSKLAQKTENLLSSIYYNAGGPAAFRGAEAVYRQSKLFDSKLT